MLIAQITDTHIVDKNNHWLAEPLTKTDERLSRTVSYINQLPQQPDIVLLTGDASDTGTEASYIHLKELLAPLKAPLFVIPGNHDNRNEMRKAFTHQSYMPKDGFIHYTLNDYPIRLIGLDTLIPGKDAGEICEERFKWLAQTLDFNDSKPTLIFMHHPLTKTGNRLFDTMLCSHSSAFESLIKRQTNLLGILSGHYHQLCVASYQTKSCFIAPSVAPVHFFADPEDDFVTALELEDPAVTLHKWHGGNSMTSHVHRIKEKNHRINWTSIKSK